jgi:hypothetical protein
MYINAERPAATSSHFAHVDSTLTKKPKKINKNFIACLITSVSDSYEKFP